MLGRGVRATRDKAVHEPHDLRFLRTELQSELTDALLDESACLFSGVAILTQHHEVVGISHEAIASLIELPVEDFFIGAMFAGCCHLECGDSSPLSLQR